VLVVDQNERGCEGLGIMKVFLEEQSGEGSSIKSI